MWVYKAYGAQRRVNETLGRSCNDLPRVCEGGAVRGGKTHFSIWFKGSKRRRAKGSRGLAIVCPTFGKGMLFAEAKRMFFYMA